ncbi:MAG: MFS transporter [bacterium]
MATGTAGSLEARGAPSARPFLGWRMVGIAFVAQGVASSITLSPFGNFIIPLSEAFGVPRGTIGLGIPIAILLMGLLGPFVGRALDLGRARWLMTIGALVSGVGLIALAWAETLWQAAWLFGGLVCVGVGLFGMMPSMALVASWFVQRRGLALGVTVAGATVASYLAPASAEYLIQQLGWRQTLLLFGVGTLGVCVPLFGIWTIGRPEDVGQLPDGASSTEGDTIVGSPSSTMLGTGELARDPRLWQVAIGFGLILTSPIVLLGILVPFGKDLGFSGQEANLFFAAMVPFSLLGKLAIGALADLLPPRRSIVFVAALNVGVWAMLYLEPTYGLFLVTGAIYGLGIGGAAPLQGVVVGLCFGRANFGRAQGLGGLVAVPLMAAASVVSNLLLNATGHYQSGFVLQMAWVTLGGLLLLGVPIPRSENESLSD